MKRILAIAALALAALPDPGAAQAGWGEQMYYPGSFNWQLRARYPTASKLFNAFDYGHAVLYETLWTRPDGPVSLLETEQYAFLTTDLLRRPPRFAIAEGAVQPEYAKLAWTATLMFDWAHVLHRQIYDIYADERVSPVARDSLIERVTDYYLSNREAAFTALPKTMALMDEQPYSKVFRRRYPKFNGLIWAYHWLQVGLYEPLIEESNSVERSRGVAETLDRFWAMLEQPPARMPEVMPMTAAVAPRFAEAHPRAACIFDNLHMMHDIISDILASPVVPRAGKAQAIARALAEFQDGTKNVMSLEDWRMMGHHMGGVERMGGVAGRKKGG
ncbi:MAG: hypothetical protein ABI647_08050 [Gemmatimonadota bacterium]